MTGQAAEQDPRRQLAALWDTLASFGAVVRHTSLDELPDDVVEALCSHEARRIRALIEGLAAGWAPPAIACEAAAHGRAVARHLTHTRDEPASPPTEHTPPAAPDQRERPRPIQVRHHQPRWRSIA